MQFVVTGYDGNDDNAEQRRMDARNAHITNLEKLYNEGSILYAAALTDDDGKMIGSMVVAEYDSETAMQENWLDNEAYVVQNVWQKIEIKPARIAGFCKK